MRAAIHERKVPQNLIAAYFDRIESTKRLNAFTYVNNDPTKVQAYLNSLDHTNKKKRLQGIPIAVKDNIHVAGMPSTCGSKMLNNYVPSQSATVVKKMIEEGAFIIGKTNMDEFAMGSTNLHTFHKAAINPWKSRQGDPDSNKDRIAGGSSGGSAVAVATKSCFAALGSDTGGSVRQPAAHCGVFALKPSYGRLSRRGLVAFSSSLDCISIIGKSVEDLALMLDVCSGEDDEDATTIREPPTNTLDQLDRDMRPLKIGIPKEYYIEELDESILKSWKDSVEILKSEGIEVKEISLPHTRYALPSYYIISSAEASSNLARYDGIKYGYRNSEKEFALDETRSEGFGDEVKRRILLGTFVLSRGSYHLFYEQAQKVRRKVANDFIHAFESVDALITPTTAAPAMTIEKAKNSSPVMEYAEDVMTVAVNLAGLPATAIPVGFHPSGLPISLQVIAPFGKEISALRVSKLLDFHFKYSDKRM